MPRARYAVILRFCANGRFEDVLSAGLSENGYAASVGKKAFFARIGCLMEFREL